MEQTQLAQAIADVLVYCGTSIGGSTAVLTSIYIATALLSELLSNNSAAAIMYPVSLQVGGGRPRRTAVSFA
jgi:di/tricarboxylate transporter